MSLSDNIDIWSVDEGKYGSTEDVRRQVTQIGDGSEEALRILLFHHVSYV